MSEAQYTPGPWRADEPTEIEWPMGEVNIYAGDDSIVAGVIPHTSMDVLTANARLIAAAPDLLDALVELERISHDEDDWCGSGRLADALDDARAAIAKATAQPTTT